MTLNYNANGKEIQAAYDRASGSPDGDKWVIYDYEGNSNTIRVGEEGVGGLDEFASSFSSGKLQFGVIAVKLSSDVLSKIILVHWQGEGVPTLRLASTTSHAEEFRRFLKTVHIVLHARSEIDVEPDVIRKEVRKLPSTNASANAESTYSMPEKVESVYKPTKPNVDLNHSTREEFWSKMNDEEKRRQAEEKKSRELQQKQYEEDRKRIANEIHSKAENYQPEAVVSVYKPVKPHVELKPSEREQFWNQMNEEEKKRVSEEKAAREAQQKQYEEDRQRTAKEIHTQAEQYQPDKITSVYKPVKPHVELNASAREEFWSKMNEEEKKRVAEEKLANEARQKQFDADRKRTNDDIQSKLQSQQASAPEKPKVDATATSSKQPTIVGGLVGSRKEIFSNKGSEPAPFPKSPSTGGGVKKWPPVATNHENERRDEPVNRVNDSVVENQYHHQEKIVEEPKHTYVPEPFHAAPTYDAYEEPPAEPAPAPPALNLKSAIVPPPQSHQSVTPPAEPTPANYSSQYDAPPVCIPPSPQSIPSHIASQYDAPPEPSEPEEETYSYAAKKNEPPAHISSQYDMPPVIVEEPIVSAPRAAAAPIDQYDFPPSVDTNEQRALALWDYQAADDTEISFDPDDIITEIDQVDSGWWKGRAPNGRVGLFPANYVKLM